MINKSSEFAGFNQLLLVGILIVSVVVFIIDIQFPLGVAGGIPYALIVMATYWFKLRRVTVGAGVLGTILIIAGFFLSESTEYIVLAGANRLMSITVIWGCVWFVNNYKTSLDQTQKDKKRISALFEATTDEILVFQLDEELNPLPFMEVNSIACDILGYTRQDLLQKTVYDIVAATKKEIDERIEYINKHNKTVLESRHKTKEGNIIPIEISARAFMYNGRKTIISLGRDIRERKKLEQEILNISERERQRIGRDMHDSLGQMLTGIGLIASKLARELTNKEQPLANKVKEIADMVKEADKHARSLARGLMPVQIESNGLDAALQELTNKASRRYNIKIRYTTEKVALDDNSAAIHLYRIAQEALNNAIKHAKATEIKIQLLNNKNHIALSVKDNGKGFLKSEETLDGMGIRIMEYRIQMIGGELRINTEQGAGTEIICQIPKNNDLIVLST